MSLAAFDQQCHGSVVDQRDSHISLKKSGFNAQTGAPRDGDKMFVQGQGLFGGSGIVEAGPAAFTAIAIKGELRDDEKIASGIEEAAIHLALSVFENTQIQDLLSDEFGVGVSIEFRDTEKHEKSPPYFACDGIIYNDARFGDAL